MINGPEKRDADFSWREFIHRHNGELLGAFGNFVNRTLVFIHKYFDGKVPLSTDPVDILEQLNTLYSTAGLQIEQGELKNALEDIFSFIRKANKYFDEQKPWIQIKEAPANCSVTVNTCIQIIANLSNLLEPFLPFTCAKIRSFLSLPVPCWDYTEIPGFHPISLTEILFQRIDPGQIEEELKKINGR